MTKEQWQSLYNILYRIHSDFLIAYPTYKNGKNKKIRSDAERDVDNAIRLADYHIRGNWDAFKLLTGGENSSDFGRAIIHDEFLLPRYFGGDMGDLLKVIRNKINSLE
jgi:hypothetical protein